MDDDEVEVEVEEARHPHGAGGVVSDHDEADGESSVGTAAGAGAGAASRNQRSQIGSAPSHQNGATNNNEEHQHQAPSYPPPPPPDDQDQQQELSNPHPPPGAVGPWLPPLNPLSPGYASPHAMPQQQQQQQLPPPPASQHALAMAQYYEARMRDHAAAYASAAAGAAWAAAQIAAQAAEFAANANALPPGGAAVVAELPQPPPTVAAALPPMHHPPPPGFYSPTPNSHNANAESPLATGNNLYHPAPPMGMAPPPFPAMPDSYPYNHTDDPNYYYNDANNNNNHWNDASMMGQGRNHSWYNNDNQDGIQDEAYYHHQHHQRNTRRKRYQRRPPGGITVPRRNNSFHQQESNNPNPSNSSSNNNNNASRVRRRLRDGGDSSNSSCCSGSLGTSITSYNSDQPMMGGTNNNNHLQNASRGPQHSSKYNSSNYHRGASYTSGGGGRGNTYHRTKKKQRQPPDDSSLQGKTAVAALYEYCSKRHMAQPTFALTGPEEDPKRLGGHRGPDFDVAVFLEDGVEWGRGRGRTKTSAKQEAARKALHALVPGVEFDELSGILTSFLPRPYDSPTAAAADAPNAPRNKSTIDSNDGPNAEDSASLEDLVAERLAIATGPKEDNGTTNKTDAKMGGEIGAFPSNNKLKRTWNVYPGTTTSTGTSEEEDENSFLSSRGASVVSVLLHALVHIDDRIIEPPQHSFELLKEVNTSNTQMKRKDPASSGGGAIVIHRGTYTCTANLKVLSRSTDCSAGTVKGEVAERNQSELRPQPDGDGVTETFATEKEGLPKDDQSKTETSHDAKPDKALNQLESNGDKEDLQYTVLEVKCVGSNKREAKHIANSKLLALLFPECETMVEVKAAAEAVRDKYAASKALRKSKRGRQSVRGRAKIPRLSSEILHNEESDPPLPIHILQQLQALVEIRERPAMKKSSLMCPSFEKLNLNQESTDDAGDKSQDLICRQLSRQKQLEEQVDKALQALNEHDEEGRPLPEELTADDVGLTVLRRATLEDKERVRRLVSDNTDSSSPGRKRDASALAPVTVLGNAALDNSADTAGDRRKAKLNQDDGALALRLWGSNTIVLLLCRAIAAFEDPPLGCAVLTLGFSMQKGRLLRIAQIGSEPHLPRERFLECLEKFSTCMGFVLDRNDSLEDGSSSATSIWLNRDNLMSMVGSFCGAREERARLSMSSPLQSVQEESEGGDDSERSPEAKIIKKGQDKPCKRSRVE